MSAAELEQGLTDQWELLSRGRRTAPHRQSTMAACIEWSFDLCTPAERTLWARASVFVDGFEYDAAAAVCSGPDDDEPVDETLASLVEKSVLAATAGRGHARASGCCLRSGSEVWPSWHGSARKEQRRRHRDFYLDLVTQAHDGWFSSSQLQWIDRVRREVGNIAEALERCVRPSRLPWTRGSGPARNLLEFIRRGTLPAGTALVRPVARPPIGRPDLAGARPEGRLLVGVVARGRRVGSTLARRRAGTRRPAWRRDQLLLTQAAGLVAMYAGDLDEAEHLLDDALRASRRSGNAAESAHCWMLLPTSARYAATRTAPWRATRAGLAMTEPVGETWLRSWFLWAAGLAQWTRGDASPRRGS